MVTWLRRPVFSEDGESYTLEKWREVPDGSIKTIGTITFEELKSIYWKGKDNGEK